jgi:hypothetical protein
VKVHQSSPIVNMKVHSIGRPILVNVHHKTGVRSQGGSLSHVVEGHTRTAPIHPGAIDQNPTAPPVGVDPPAPDLRVVTVRGESGVVRLLFNEGEDAIHTHLRLPDRPGGAAWHDPMADRWSPVVADAAGIRLDLERRQTLVLAVPPPGADCVTVDRPDAGERWPLGPWTGTFETGLTLPRRRRRSGWATGRVTPNSGPSPARAATPPTSTSRRV